MGASNNYGYTSFFASQLRKVLDEQGKSLTDVAKNIGVTRQAVSYYYNGDTLPTLETLTHISEYLGVSIDYLVRGVSSDNRSINETLGLSERSIEILKALKRLDDVSSKTGKVHNSYSSPLGSFVSALNSIIENMEHSAVIEDLMKAAAYAERNTDTASLSKDADSYEYAPHIMALERGGYKVLPPHEEYAYTRDNLMRNISAYVEAALFSAASYDERERDRYSVALHDLRTKGIGGAPCNVWEYADRQIKRQSIYANSKISYAFKTKGKKRKLQRDRTQHMRYPIKQ